MDQRTASALKGFFQQDISKKKKEGGKMKNLIFQPSILS